MGIIYSITCTITNRCYIGMSIKTLEQRPKKHMSANTGNVSWKGQWVTLAGTFNYIKEASYANKISAPTLSKLCKNNDRQLNNHIIKLNKTLKRLNALAGQTPAELSFSFKEVQH